MRHWSSFAVSTRAIPEVGISIDLVPTRCHQNTLWSPVVLRLYSKRSELVPNIHSPSPSLPRTLDGDLGCITTGDDLCSLPCNADWACFTASSPVLVNAFARVLLLSFLLLPLRKLSSLSMLPRYFLAHNRARSLSGLATTRLGQKRTSREMTCRCDREHMTRQCARAYCVGWKVAVRCPVRVVKYKHF